MGQPTKAYRSARGTGETTLHLDDTCRVLQNVKTVREVNPRQYEGWKWCPFCSGDVEGVESAPVPKAEGEKLSTRLRKAESLDEL